MNKKSSSRSIVVGLIILALVMVTGAGCKISNDNNSQGEPEEEEVDPNAPKVLFIGSSYLAINNFRGIFRDLVKAGGKSLNVHNRFVQGVYLSYHSGNPETINLIYSEQWDYVILQGGCHFISKPKWHEEILPFIERLNEMIKDNCEDTKTVYLMPWAYSDGLTWAVGEGDTYEEMSQNILNESTKFAHEIDIIVAPVGWTWFNVTTSDEYYINLYQDDYNHPSISGTYLTACVFYVTIFQESLENNGFYFGIPEEKAKFMQRTASSTVLNDLELWNIPQ
jgi:hypothetical protein